MVALDAGGHVELREIGLGPLRIRPDDIEPIMNSLRAADYASIRGVGGINPEVSLNDVAAGKE